MRTYRRSCVILLVVCLGLGTIIAACTPTPTPTAVQPQASRTPTRRPPTAIPPTETPAPEGDPAPAELVKVLETNMPVGSEPVRLFYQISEHGNQAQATYEVTSFWTVPGALRDCLSSFTKTAPAAFQADTQLTTLETVYLVTLYDDERKPILEPLLVITLGRETAEDVDWENLKRCDVPNVVEELTVHPSELESWDSMCTP